MLYAVYLIFAILTSRALCEYGSMRLVFILLPIVVELFLSTIIQRLHCLHVLLLQLLTVTLSAFSLTRLKVLEVLLPYLAYSCLKVLRSQIPYTQKCLIL